MVTGYELSRAWWDWCFENPEKISPNHSAIYFFAIEHCNRLGWKAKFGFPTQMAMDALGIKKHETYIRYFSDLVNWGFITLIQRSSNQYSANIISLKIALPKNGKALGKAILNHAGKQTESNGESNSSIDKPITTKPNNNNNMDFNSDPNELLKSQRWAEAMCAKHGLKNFDELKLKLQMFNTHILTIEDENEIKTESDYKRHLNNWLNKQPKKAISPPKKSINYAG